MTAITHKGWANPLHLPSRSSNYKPGNQFSWPFLPANRPKIQPRDQLNRLVSQIQTNSIDRRIRYCKIPAGDRKEPSFEENNGGIQRIYRGNRRDFVVKPLLAIGFYFLHSVARAEDSNLAPAAKPSSEMAAGKVDDVITSRVYDATVIGEPLATGKDKSRVWDKLLNARIVYLGEAEQVPVRDDKVDDAITSRVYDAPVIGGLLAVGKDMSRVWDKLLNARIVYLGEVEQVPDHDDKDLELEIVRNLRNKCFEERRPISVALEAFPWDLQEKLNDYMSKRIDGEGLRSYTLHWPPNRWQEYEPLLSYCRDNGVRLVACGTPLEVLRTVQAEGIRGLSAAERKIYAPPAGSGFIAGFTSSSRSSPVDMISSNPSGPFGPSSYLSAQARVVEDYTMSQIIMQAMLDGGLVGMLVVVTGASHVVHGSRGVGIPARISKKLQKKNQAVILLNPERQRIRQEGEVPVADFLWYTAARPCSRNCFDRAEIARVMNAAGRRRDALPVDLQKGLDLGLVSPEVLQNLFDLEQYPFIAELIHRFQGFRERLLADPKFLHRLAIEEAISITTTLLAQYERRKENFFEELDYVLTDTVRGSVVDFFTVWLPAPTLSFLTYDDQITIPENFEILKGLLGSIPDNAFQMNSAGKEWTLNHRLASVLVGGLKLSGVGFISSIGTVAVSNLLYAVRIFLNPSLVINEKRKRSPIFKTALVYGSFLGTSANLRYQIIAGIVEHRISDQFLSSQPFLVNMLSFLVRTINSYWGTQQWVDLARVTGLQTRKAEPSYQPLDVPAPSLLDNTTTNATTIDEINNQSGDNSAS